MRVLSIVICCVSILLAPLAVAHSGATGIVKERMQSMKQMGKASKAIAQAMRTKSAIDMALIGSQARVIEQHSLDIEKHFPAGSLQGKSEALEAIWLNWNDFIRLTGNTEQAADKLANLAAAQATKPELMKQFAKLGKSCKSCHKVYRKRK